MTKFPFKGLHSPPVLPPTPTSPTAPVSMGNLAALYGPSLWPSFNAFLHYQRLAIECQQLGLNKLVPCNDADFTISSKGIVKSKQPVLKPFQKLQ